MTASIRTLAFVTAVAAVVTHAPPAVQAEQAQPTQQTQAAPDGAAPDRQGPASPETAGEVVVGAVDAVLSEHEVDVTLRGSPASMARQHAVAVASDLSFVGTLDEMEALAAEGELVGIDGGRHYEVMDWVFPYGLPPVERFVERLAYEYRQSCGEEMVVTSLTRPFSEQPGNSHQLSVHPAGMAVDLRVPQTPECRAFLEERLLEKEEEGLVDITHERAPPHYHVAVYPEPYAQWAAMQPPLPEEATAAEQEIPTDPDPPGQEGDWALTMVILGLIVAAGAWWLIRR